MKQSFSEFRSLLFVAILTHPALRAPLHGGDWVNFFAAWDAIELTLFKKEMRYRGARVR